VLSKEDEATADFVVEMKLTKSQLRGEDPIPIHLGVGRKLFVCREPLSSPYVARVAEYATNENA
jgi:hypothetical protein